MDNRHSPEGNTFSVNSSSSEIQQDEVMLQLQELLDSVNSLKRKIDRVKTDATVEKKNDLLDEYKDCENQFETLKTRIRQLPKSPKDTDYLAELQKINTILNTINISKIEIHQ